MGQCLEDGQTEVGGGVGQCLEDGQIESLLYKVAIMIYAEAKVPYNDSYLHLV